MGESEKVRSLFLICVASVYLIAFVSLFVQIPGLYGNDGILPVRLALDKEMSTFMDAVAKQPTLLHLLVKMGVKDVELAFNLICFSGIVLSFLAFVKSCFRSSFVFLLLWLFYQSLFQVGQTFLWFQWDTLLLELGFLVIFVAPLRLPFVDLPQLTRHCKNVSFWLVRWMTFRLMFSSGVVKLNSQCPTWWGLTAMTYHYESQCIPSPLAWYAHQLPLWFQRASTAFVFIIQIITTILFFSPYRAHRIFSFLIQSFLMVLIILTGNYNFFNWVSIVMCLSLVDDDFLACLFGLKSQDNHKEYVKPMKGQKLTKVAQVLMKVMKVVVHTTVIGTVVYVAHRYFSIRFNFAPFRIESNIEFTYEEFQTFLHWFVPLTIWVASASLALTVVCSFFRSLLLEKGLMRKVISSFCVVFMSLVAVTIFCITLVPYTDMHRETQMAVPQSFVKWHRQTRELNIFNAYGLFRSNNPNDTLTDRMTGVGGRPEVIVEGSNDLEGEWQELNFLFKPGDVSRRLPVVAPHQPRLDWQMWFAALGSYNYNPWFYHLAYRILTHEKEVLALMDKGPFDDAPPKYIRAHLYHYHFTGWNDTTSSWWRREYQGEYLPVLSLDDSYLMDYVKKTGLYVDPNRHHMDFSRKSLPHYFFKFLHSILQARFGFEVCTFFLLLGIFLHYFSTKSQQGTKEKHSPGKQQKQVDAGQKLLKQS